MRVGPRRQPRDEFVFKTAVMIIAAVVLGAGAVYAWTTLDGDPDTEPPSAVTLILGVSLVQMSAIVRENGFQRAEAVLSDGITTTQDAVKETVEKHSHLSDQRQKEIVDVLQSLHELVQCGKVDLNK